jgi:PilZ domain
MSLVEPRFAVDKSVKFRPQGRADWQSGRTLNLSRSGLLFACEEPVAVGTVIELVLLDQDLQGRFIEAPNSCFAEVVRRVLMAWPDVGLLLGVRFMDRCSPEVRRAVKAS